MTRARIAAVVVIAALAGAGCGEDDEEPDEGQSGIAARTTATTATATTSTGAAPSAIPTDDEISELDKDAEQSEGADQGPAPLPSPSKLPEPDTTGTKFENGISAYIIAGTSAPTAVKVRCGGAQPNAKRILTCTGTRPRTKSSKKTYSYTIDITIQRDGTGIDGLEINSEDDKTGTIDTD